VRRRTKPRVVWLPQTNRNSLGDLTTVYQLALISWGGVTGSHTTVELPLVIDAQQSPLDANNPSLSDIASSGYRLRRIVGKVWCQLAQGIVDPAAAGAPAATRPQSAIVTAGIMVRRTDQATGDSLASLASGTDEGVSPALIDNTLDPWVWRRSWWLGDNKAAGNVIRTATSAFFDVIDYQNILPTTNFGREYPGGIAEGPHVDQKTARIVGPEERLFLDVTVTTAAESINPAAEQSGTVAVITDLRVLGSLRTNSGNRRNASR